MVYPQAPITLTRIKIPKISRISSESEAAIEMQKSVLVNVAEDTNPSHTEQEQKDSKSFGENNKQDFIDHQ